MAALPHLWVEKQQKHVSRRFSTVKQLLCPPLLQAEFGHAVLSSFVDAGLAPPGR